MEKHKPQTLARKLSCPHSQTPPEAQHSTRTSIPKRLGQSSISASNQSDPICPRAAATPASTLCHVLVRNAACPVHSTHARSNDSSVAGIDADSATGTGACWPGGRSSRRASLPVCSLLRATSRPSSLSTRRGPTMTLPGPAGWPFTGLVCAHTVALHLPSILLLHLLFSSTSVCFCFCLVAGRRCLGCLYDAGLADRQTDRQPDRSDDP